MFVVLTVYPSACLDVFKAYMCFKMSIASSYFPRTNMNLGLGLRSAVKQEAVMLKRLEIPQINLHVINLMSLSCCCTIDGVIAHATAIVV